MRESDFGGSSINDQLIELAADVVAAYVSNNAVPIGELPSLVQDIHRALSRLHASETQQAETLTPAVPIKKSVTPDFLISLENGRKFKSLKRHLMTAHGMTPDDYRRKWGLPANYPMVAPNYAAARSSLAKGMGLGRKLEPLLPPKKRGRKPAK